MLLSYIWRGLEGGGFFLKRNIWDEERVEGSVLKMVVVWGKTLERGVH